MIIYTATAGDTLYSIARRFGLTVGELERFNGFTNPDALSIGQDVLIPVDESNHTVSRGESLYSIAIEYGVAVDEIIAANPDLRPPYIIYPNMELLIPKPSSKRRTPLASRLIRRGTLIASDTTLRTPPDVHSPETPTRTPPLAQIYPRFMLSSEE